MDVKRFVANWVLPPGVAQAYNRLRAPLKGSRQQAANPLLAATEALRGRHRGERCFILGAGPSIKQQDLGKLVGENVISVSNSFVHPDFPRFRPRYHVVPHILHGHGFHAEDQLAKWLREMEQRTFAAEMFFHIGDKELIERHGLFRGRTIHWNEYVPWDREAIARTDLARVPAIWSVSEFALTVAVHLGFSEIYLLGFDHDWFNGLFRYFYDEKKDHVLCPEAARVPHVDAEFQMRRHADIFLKYKQLRQLHGGIFNANANPRHYLDVFPKVEYDSLFAAPRQRDLA